MLYRDVVENRSITLNYDTYIFVGFNLLNKVEQALFRHLQQQGKAKFYWDFDDYYMKGHEAGFFISQYLSSFPNELDHSREEIYRQFANDKQIRFVAAPTENIQAHYIADWLADEQRKNGGKRTAILAYLELRPKHFYSITADVGGPKFVTARGWEDLSVLLFSYESLGIAVDEGTVGQYLQDEEIARDFAAYLDLYAKYRDDYGVENIFAGEVRGYLLENRNI